jgi:hypothetical protein
MKKCKVSICGCQAIEAMVYDYWNGFAMPYIAFSEVQKFVDEYTNEFVEITFVDGVLKLYDMQESYTEFLFPVSIEGVVYYDLGGLGYSFEIEDEPIVESLSYIEDNQIVVAVRSNKPFEGAEFDGEMYVMYNQIQLK